MRDGLLYTAPCKINLHLAVFGRRPDGFHELESLFQALAFGDELKFSSLKDRSVCELYMDGSVPTEQNSIYKAVQLFRSSTGYDGGVRIEVRKHIPLGAGLGGGSSDAATTLLALNDLADTGLSETSLLDLASRLGSDVPFFISPGTVYVTGRGEELRHLPNLAGFWFVLVNPGVHSGTPGAFRLLDTLRDEGLMEVSAPVGFSVLGDALGDDPRHWPYFNDFLQAFRLSDAAGTASVYDRILRDLSSWGADFSGLSGSGSTCFGVFRDKRRAEEAVYRLSRVYTGTQLTFPLARPVDAVVQ